MDRRTPIEVTTAKTVHVSHWAAYRMTLIKIGGLELLGEAHSALKKGLPFIFEGATMRVLTQQEKRDRYGED